MLPLPPAVLLRSVEGAGEPAVVETDSAVVPHGAVLSHNIAALLLLEGQSSTEAKNKWYSKR